MISDRRRGGKVIHQGRGAADRGEYRQAAGAMRGFVMCVALAGIYFPVAVFVKAPDAAQEGSSWRKPFQN
jgi:hypothetical protein